MGSIRRARELSDIDPQYIAKSGLCSASELESSKWGSIRIQHVTGLSNLAEGKSRFPKLDECAHFHYDHVEIGPLQVSIVDDDNLKPLFTEPEDNGKWWSLSVNCQGKTWLLRRSYDNFRMLDQQLHRCIYDRKFSGLSELPEECIENQENLHKVLSDYMKRFSVISGNIINCGPVLNWLELDNRGHRLLVPDNDNCPINTPAVAAAYSIKRYAAQAPDEISFEVGDMISVIDMPPPEESIWWHGKRGFEVGFFPCECVAVIGDKVPRNLQLSHRLTQPTKPVLRKHGKLIAFFRSFILSRPSRRRLKQSGILKERVFGCDLGEHLLNSGHEIPMVLKCCVEFIETHGLIDGIYRLSGITSNIQKLRNAFDEDRVPGLYEDEAILQDVHSVASLLKMYFRELPNPLCTYQLYHQFVEAVQINQEEESKLLKMRDVVQKLPPPHYRTLGYLMRHLARVSEKGHETGMTSRNVAIVWAPNLLRCKELEVGGVAALQGVGVQAVVTEFLVCYADLIFCDRLPNFSVPSQQGSSKKCRPKSLAISTPTKLLSLEEARTRALLQASGRAEPEYIEVGGGPANLPAKYHTVIELPGYSRKGGGSKRSPIGWKLLFGKSGRSSQRKETENKPSTPYDAIVSPEKTSMELDLAQSRRYLRPAKSAESLDSSRNSEMADMVAPLARTIENSLSPALLRTCEGKGNGHNRSVSHESYFDHFQDQKDKLTSDMSEIQMNFDLEESELKIFSEDETLLSTESGSLASNCSPQILPLKKAEKLTATSSVKRSSQPKSMNSEDGFENGQNADPSPKKPKTNDESSPSKLEEQLSSSMGEIQFIDSVSPDQVLLQSEIPPIQSSSPASSISQISSSLLPSSSPILPHIPHLIKSFSETSELQNCTSGCTIEAPDSCGRTESNVSPNSFFETPISSSSYTPLIEFEESSLSDVTIPDADATAEPANSVLENVQTGAMHSRSESVEREDLPEVVTDSSDDPVEVKSGNENAAKPEEKHEEVDSCGDVPIVDSDAENNLLPSMPTSENNKSNRNSVVSIRYESISTESSCDSLINANREGGEEETLPLTCRLDPERSSSECFQTNLLNFFTDGIKMDEQDDESRLKMETSPGNVSGSPSHDYENVLVNSIRSEGGKESEESATLGETEDSFDSDGKKMVANMESSEVSEGSTDDGISLIENETKMATTSLVESPEEETSLVEGNGKGEESAAEKKANVEEHSGCGISMAEEEPRRREGKDGVLETDLDAIQDLPTETLIAMEKKEICAGKSSSSENVRQLLTKFEVVPVSERSTKRDDSVGGESDSTMPESADPTERVRRVQLGKSKSGSQINGKSHRDKEEVLSGCEFDFSDPQRRERIERYKEKRRNYLREKYRGDSFKCEKDDPALSKIRQRHLSKRDPRDGLDQEESSSQSLQNGKKNPDKREKSVGPKFWKALDSIARESGQRSSPVEVSGPGSSGDEPNRKNSPVTGNAYDFRRARSSPEKKNIFLNFSLGRSSSKEDSSSVPTEPPGRKKMTDGMNSSGRAEPEVAAGVGLGKRWTDDPEPEIPVVCIKEMAALFERRNDPKPAKQYLSSV